MSNAKKNIVVGLGSSGNSIVSFLLSKNKKVFVWDDNEIKQQQAVDKFGANHVSKFNKHTHTVCKNDVVVLSPGIARPYNTVNHSLVGGHFLAKMALEAGASLVSSFDIFKSQCSKQTCLIGVTGSVGKSTIVTIVHKILQGLGNNAAMGGNIGIPYFDIQPFNAKYNILELSSYELENSQDPSVHIGVIINIFPHHLDRHQTLDKYIDAKLRIFNASSIAVLNDDDQNSLTFVCAKLEEKFGSDFIKNNIRFFSTKRILPKGTSIVNSKCYIDGKNVDICIPSNFLQFSQQRQKQPIFFATPTSKNLSSFCNSKASGLPTDNSKRVGTLLTNANNVTNIANISNTAAALELVRAKCCLEPKKVNNALSQIVNLEHRNEEIARINNIVFINDSKSTSYISTAMAIKSLPKNIILIAGGKIKNHSQNKGNAINFTDNSDKEFINAVKKVLHVFLIGEVGKYYKNTNNKEKKDIFLAGYNNALVTCDNLQNATNQAYDFALNYANKNQNGEDKKSDIYILFSPGFTSFDEFDNFVHRGNTFKQLVLGIVERK
ncbi:MAG: UDP-N-acetylmuramoyl-L-alanine--D-glutamate ligase [Alphaproteobacteria bacterium]|nr:UDP-N-acetylmuramoyl-L-alanine--D-glutamate ligase [Rickettsiales bacterium]